MEEKINELENKRKLATIAVIRDVQPIEGADNIELVFVRGWQCVAKKGEFKVGDMCVYVEVDSIMPDGLDEINAANWKALNKSMSKAADEEERDIIRGLMDEITLKNTRPEFEFLRGIKFHIKTRKILGEVSQGICFPLNILDKLGEWKSVIGEPNYSAVLTFGLTAIPIVEGEDLTDLLGVTQYEAPDPATMGGDAAGTLQAVGLLVSDEERIENLYGKYEKLRQYHYIKTEKLEGTSFTCYLKGGKFGVCGRTIDFKIPEEDEGYDQMNVYWKVAQKFDLEKKMRDFAFTHDYMDNDFAWQGELVGEGIQKNIYKLKGQRVAMYNAFDITLQEYFDYDAFLIVMDAMGVMTVPVLDRDFILPEDPKDLLMDADKALTVFGNDPTHLAEGHVYVAKGDIPKGTRLVRGDYGRLSFKAKSREYKI